MRALINERLQFRRPLKQHATSFLIGILSSVAATWLITFMPMAGNDSPGLIALLLAPVPLLALFFVTAVTTVVAWAISTRMGASADAKVESYKEAAGTAQSQVADMTRRLQALTADGGARHERRIATARRVIAAVQSPGPSSSLTRQELCQILLKLQGNDQSEVDINDVIGWLLAEDVLVTVLGKIEVNLGWQRKLASLGAQSRGGK